MTDDDEAEFRKNLRRSPTKPSSRSAGYVVAGVLVLAGGVSLAAARSSAATYGSAAIIAAGLFAAGRAYRQNARWGPK